MKEPNPILDPIVPAIRSYALVTAVSAGMFGALEPGPADAGVIAQRCGLDREAVELLAAVMCAGGYMKRTGTRYDLNEVSRTTLLESGSMSFVNWVKFSLLQLEAVHLMPEAARMLDIGGGTGSIPQSSAE